MQQQATALTSWAKAIRRTLDSRGVDSAALFEQAGLDIAQLDDPNARYLVTRTTRLWELAVAATGDPALGLAVASQVTATTFHALSYSIMASANLLEVLQRIARYFRIATDVSTYEVHQTDQTVELRTHTPPDAPQPAAEAVDAFVSLLLRTARSLAGRELTPLRIALRRAAPVDSEIYQRLWRVAVEFDAPQVLVVFARADCERPLHSANRELAKYNDEIVQRYLEQLDRASLSGRVRDALMQQLAQGEPGAEQIASTLHLSLRSLQRHLAEEGSSFEALLDECRQQLAQSYLADRRYALSEIAYLLGYADASCFTRACKRWTGMAPSKIREQMASRT